VGKPKTHPASFPEAIDMTRRGLELFKSFFTIFKAPKDQGWPKEASSLIL
jgi:hypothetical protein